MNRRNLALVIALTLLLGLAAALPFATTGAARRDLYFFDVDLTSTTAGETQVFFDTGQGFRDAESSRQPLKVHSKIATYRFLLPTGKLNALRFDPIDREGSLTATRARIVDRRRKVIHSFALSDFVPLRDIIDLREENGAQVIKTTPGGNDPIIQLQLKEPLTLPYGFRQQLQVATQPFCYTVAVVLALVGLVHLLLRMQVVTATYTALQRRPVRSLALLAGFSVAVQLHPVIFCGKSFVSPDNAAFMLYHGFPTLPGYHSDEQENAKGADVGALFYQHLYYPQMQREALFRHGELPLWNRYNLCGVPLLGQGQSMFGDLLNLIPMAGNSSAWSWDIKFIVARWLFAFVLAWIVWRLTRPFGAAALTALTAIWIGFFTFRMNHPAIFSVCYAPCVLAAWILLRDAATRPQHIVAAVCVFAAHWEMLTSGTAKEATLALLSMDWAGAALVMFSPVPARQRWNKLGAAALAGIVFLLVSAPLWLTFLDTLAVSRTSYDKPTVWQTPTWQFIGFFEDLLNRRFRPNEFQWNPSTNIVVLVGFALAIAFWSELRRNRDFLALSAVSLVVALFVFGVVPPALILHVPLLKNVYYIDNAFGGALVSLLTVFSAFGFKTLIEQCQSVTIGRATIASVAVIVGIVGIYAGFSLHSPTSAFFRGYILSLVLTIGIGLVAIAGLRQNPAARIAILLVCLVFGLWRHGQYVETSFDDYVFNPKVRADFHAQSPVLRHVDELMKEPSRPAGLGLNLFSGFNQIYDWEGIYGVDALRNGAYDELTTAGSLKKIRWWEYSNFGDETDDWRPMMDLLNCRYYLGYPTQASGLKTLNHLGSFDLDLFESPTAWPRAFFVSRGFVARSLGDVISATKLAQGKPFAAIMADDVKISAAPSALLQPVSNPVVVRARDYRLTGNTTTFTVDAPSAGLVVLTEAYYPRDFRVYVNERPSPYFRVNYAFKGVAVNQPGTYLIRFEYWPHRLTLALGISAAGFALGVVLLVTLTRPIKRSRQA